MKVVCITGARTGIGQQLAYLYKEQGYYVIGTTRSAIQLPNCDQTLHCDLTKPDELMHLIATQPIDLLILCAGQTHGQLEELMMINATVPIRLSEWYIEQCFAAQRTGLVMTVCSTVAVVPQPFMASYAASKSALYMYTISRNAELEGTGIHLIATCPGPTDTDALALWRERFSPWERKWLMDSKTVAQSIVKAARRRRPVTIIGLRNQLYVRVLRLLPFRWQSWIVCRLCQKMRGI